MWNYLFSKFVKWLQHHCELITQSFHCLPEKQKKFFIKSSFETRILSIAMMFMCCALIAPSKHICLPITHQQTLRMIWQLMELIEKFSFVHYVSVLHLAKHKILFLVFPDDLINFALGDEQSSLWSCFAFICGSNIKGTPID